MDLSDSVFQGPDSAAQKPQIPPITLPTPQYYRKRCDSTPNYFTQQKKPMSLKFLFLLGLTPMSPRPYPAPGGGKMMTRMRLTVAPSRPERPPDEVAVEAKVFNTHFDLCLP